jgi:hypothetical protein
VCVWRPWNVRAHEQLRTAGRELEGAKNTIKSLESVKEGLQGSLNQAQAAVAALEEKYEYAKSKVQPLMEALKKAQREGGRRPDSRGGGGDGDESLASFGRLNMTLSLFTKVGLWAVGGEACVVVGDARGGVLARRTAACGVLAAA